MSVRDPSHPSCRKRASRKPGLYIEASSTNSSCSCDAASPLLLLPTPRLPSSFVHPSPCTTRSASPSPLLRSSSLKRARGVSSTPPTPTTTTTIVTAAVASNTVMTTATTIEPHPSRYPGLSSPPTTPTRLPNPHQPSRSERMLRATLARDRSTSCSSRASISPSHPYSQDPSCSSSVYDPFTSTAESDASWTGATHPAEPPSPSSARQEFPPFERMSHTPYHPTGSGAAGSASRQVSPSRPPTPRISSKKTLSTSAAPPASLPAFDGMRSSSPAPAIGVTRVGSENVGVRSNSIASAAEQYQRQQQQYYYARSQARPSTPTQKQIQPKANPSSHTPGRPNTPLHGVRPETLQRMHSSPASSPPTLSALRAATGATRTPPVSPTPPRHVRSASSHVKRPTTPFSVTGTNRYQQRTGVQHESQDPHPAPMPPASDHVNRNTTLEVVGDNNESRNTSRSCGSLAYYTQRQPQYYYSRGRKFSPSPSSSSSHERQHGEKGREWPGHHRSQSSHSNYATLTQAWMREAIIGECDNCSTPHCSPNPAAPAPATSTTTLTSPAIAPVPASPASTRLMSLSQAPSRAKLAASSYCERPSAERPHVPAVTVTNMNSTVRQPQRSLSPSPSSAELTTSRSSSRETESLDDDSDSDSDACVVPVHFNFAPRPGMNPRSFSSAQCRAVAQGQQKSSRVESGSGKFLTPPPSPQHVSQSATSPAPDSTIPSNQNQKSNRHSRSKSQSYPHYSSSNTSSNSSSNSSSARHSRNSSDMCAAAFDASKASAQLRLQEGYVSFADVQGLGRVKDYCDDEYDDEGRAGRLKSRQSSATGKWLLGLLGR